MPSIAIHHSEFLALLLEILRCSTLLLKTAGKLEKNESLSLSTQNSRLFGHDKYHWRAAATEETLRHRTVGYAMHLFFQNPNNSFHLKNTNLNHEKFNPRILNDLYKQYRELEQEGFSSKETIQLTNDYYHCYLAFTGYTSIHELRQESKFYQNKGRLSSPSNGEKKLYYNCYYFSNTKDKIIQFSAVFIGIPSSEKKVLVEFSGDLTSPYKGEIEIFHHNHEATITSWSNGERKNGRSLIITITQQGDRPFQKQEVCVGYYLNTGDKTLENSTGIIIFEKLPHQDTPGQLTPHHLIHFLMHPPQSLSNGGYATVEDFLVSNYYPYKEDITLAERYAGQYYLAVLISKKNIEQVNTHKDFVEVTKFHLYAPYRMRCQSDYATTTSFEGSFRFFIPNRMQLIMNGQRDSHYQILLELPANNQHPQLRGVYSGLTQEGQIAAGRVMFIPVEKATYDNTTIGAYLPNDPLITSWITRYQLKAFFSGEIDHHLDNTRVFANKVADIFIGSHELAHLPGVYYYYRTRTIRGKMREIKRFPMLLKPDGTVLVKIISGGEYQVALGTAIRIKECIYIHLTKQDRYDGLAILWPPSLRTVSERDEIIPALYVSNSKRFHVTAGRLFFVRQESELPPEDFFNQLEPTNLLPDDPGYSPEEDNRINMIIHLLSGQLNNYMAIRGATELDLPKFDKYLFYSACYLSEHGQHDEAIYALYLALMRGGFRHVEVLREAFSPGQILAPIKKGFQDYCRTMYDAIHGADQKEYLENLFRDIF